MKDELHKLLVRQLTRAKLNKDVLPHKLEDWKEFIARVNRFYYEVDQDRYLSERSIEISSHEMLDLNSKLEEAQQLASLGYWYHNRETNENIWSKELYKMFKLDLSKPAPGFDIIFKLIHPDEKSELMRLVERAFSHGESYEIETRMKNIEGQDDYRWYHIIGSPKQEPGKDQIQQIAGVTMDITARKIAEKEVASLQQQLITSARRAGMADVATAILHNIGNVLNSVNVSIHLINEYISQIDFEKLLNAEKMITDNIENLTEFFGQDSRGKLIPKYLVSYTTKLQSNYNLIFTELKTLREHLDHIKAITEMQKSVSGVSGLVEKVYVPEIIDNAIKMCGDNINKQNIEMIKEFSELPFITTDKSKLLQIMVNLLQNAKDALNDGNNHSSKKIIISLKRNSSDFITIQVKDNGIGIDKRNLIKIFSFGFTTKKTGHGFGLHSSALAAKELGGTLQAYSDGFEQGAMFSLILPINVSERTESYDHKTEFATHRD